MTTVQIERHLGLDEYRGKGLLRLQHCSCGVWVELTGESWAKHSSSTHGPEECGDSCPCRHAGFDEAVDTVGEWHRPLGA